MSKSRPSHHELPQYYLRGFCQPGSSFIWAFERGGSYTPGTKYGNNPRRLGLRKAGLRPDGYFSISRAGKRHFDCEGALQKAERRAGEVIRKARNFQPLNARDKDVLARYIGLMWRRVSTQDAEFQSMIQRHFDVSVLEAAAREFADLGEFADARGLLDDASWFGSQAGRTELLRETVLSEFDRVHAILMNLTWTLFRTSGEADFITSDVPVVYDRSIGLKKSPLHFPLSRKVLLVAAWATGDDLAWRELPPPQATAFNVITICHAHRYVYASTPEEWVQRQFTI